MDWFERLTGFREGDYHSTRDRLEVVGENLRSKVNGRVYAVGRLETPTLAELRLRAEPSRSELSGKLKVTCVSGDAKGLHLDPINANALFQVASQFNLLEMTGPNLTPEDGVTRYEHDPTQGPACAVAAGAATIYRNYFAEVDGQVGQTAQRQIDCLRDLGNALGGDADRLWTMRNGYALCSADALARIAAVLASSSPAEIDRLRGLLRIGLHWDVEVTALPEPRHRVSQAFCSALPISYTSVPADRWKAFATLVLEATYEATLCAALLNAHRTSCNTVFLTRVGGSAFGNPHEWIDHALERALDRVRGVGLDVRLVSHGAPSAGQLRIAQRYGAGHAPPRRAAARRT
ncbi:MAG: hypothetical protein KJZ83_04225 [Burkholderiaceae bacterium]|nr:hypothetical protein [Burkholderiaceae bacterium]